MIGVVTQICCNAVKASWAQHICSSLSAITRKALFAFFAKLSKFMC